jgi:hypothetical protein
MEFAHNFGGGAVTNKIILIQMIDNNTLRIETQLAPDATSQHPWTFDTNYVDFMR